ncbi:50S ribosomal protein L22 [Planctomycetaceae bacterium]|nr:50S ribosomal protein L22 [Planctomycetaceae bacterium]
MAETETKREFSASARNIRMSAQKCRTVCSAVRGRSVPEAIVLLGFIHRRAAPLLKKVIESAVANAEDYANREGMNIDTEKLVLTDARVDVGPIAKRWRARSRGQAAMILKRTCHFSATVSMPEVVAERKEWPEWRPARKRMSKDERLAKRAAKSGQPVAAKAASKPEAKKEEPKAAAKPEKKAEPKAEKAEKKADKKK